MSAPAANASANPYTSAVQQQAKTIQDLVLRTADGGKTWEPLLPFAEVERFGILPLNRGWFGTSFPYAIGGLTAEPDEGDDHAVAELGKNQAGRMAVTEIRLAPKVAFDTGIEIAEVTCPTKYFPEASSINFRRSMKYGVGVLGVSFTHFFNKLGLMHSEIYNQPQRK